MKPLKLADGLSVPLEVVTQKLAWLGVTGSGKTYGASKLAELLYHAGAQIVTLDPVGTWFGLRLAKDGKGPSALTIPIFGGLHGDVPLESTGGALLANLVVDKRLSVILDVSQFEADTDKARFARDFADRFFFRMKAAPSAVHLFLEECQEFVPQNPQRGEEYMLHAFIRMQKLGRNYGIGSSYISQRPQEVNKKALNMAQTLFVFRTTGTHERKAIEQWIHDKALDDHIADDLPKMKTGDCHVWSPEFLEVSETHHIREKETFDASVGATVGAAAVTRELAPIDLAKVAKDMAATIEKAKADDPRELRRRIAELEKEKASKVSIAPVKEKPGKPVPVLTAADRELLASMGKRLDSTAVLLDRVRSGCVAELTEVLKNIQSDIIDGEATARGFFLEQLGRHGFRLILDKLNALATYPQGHVTGHAADAKIGAPSVTEHVATPRRAPLPSNSLAGDPRLVNGKGQFKKHVVAVATAFAQHPEGLTREQVHLLTGYIPSGDTSTALAALLEHEIVGHDMGRLRPYTASIKAFGPFEPLPTGRDLREHLLGRCGSAERKMLTALFSFYHQRTPATRAELHAAAGLKPSGDTSTALSKFLKLGWAVQRDGGLVAADVFFEGP